MQIEEVSSTIDSYHALQSKVLAAARAKLVVQLAKEPGGKMADYMVKNYTSLDSFYVEDGIMYVEISWRGSYTGQNTVELSTKEVEAL